MIRSSIGIILITLSLSAVDCIATEERTFGICFRIASSGFQELELPNEVYDRLAGHPRIQVVLPQRSDSLQHEFARFNTQYYEPDLMAEMAHAMGVRYLIWLKVEKAGVRQTEHTIIPYVFHSYHRRYVLGVRMFVLDSFNKKTVASEYFESKKGGASALTYLDPDPNDPGLMQKYSLVKGKFDEMEEEISEEVAKSIVKVAHLR
jgi:hypothetical protein